MSNDQATPASDATPTSDVEIVSSDRPEVVAEEQVQEDKKAASTAKTAKDESSKDEEHEDSDASEDEELDEESSDSGDSAEDEKPKKQTGRQKRISKLIKQRAKAEAEAQVLRDQLAQYQNPKAQDQEAKTQEVTPAATATDSSRPSPDDYDSQEDYIEAIADWKYEQRKSVDEKKQAQENQKTQYQQTRDSFTARAIEFGKAKSDYEEVIAGVGDLSPSLTVQQIWFEAGEDGPALMYEMAKDPEEFERINNLSPILAARAIGRIEARLSNEPSQTQQNEIRTTKTPKPVTPVGTKSTGASSKSLADMAKSGNYEDYKRTREEELRNTRR